MELKIPVSKWPKKHKFKIKIKLKKKFVQYAGGKKKNWKLKCLRSYWGDNLVIKLIYYITINVPMHPSPCCFNFVYYFSFKKIGYLLASLNVCIYKLYKEWWGYVLWNVPMHPSPRCFNFVLLQFYVCLTKIKKLVYFII